MPGPVAAQATTVTAFTRRALDRFLAHGIVAERRRASVPHRVRHYDERRTQSALGNRPPLDRVREVTGLGS